MADRGGIGKKSESGEKNSHLDFYVCDGSKMVQFYSNACSAGQNLLLKLKETPKKQQKWVEMLI